MFNRNSYTEKIQHFFNLRNFTDNTIKNYISAIKAYLDWLEENELLPETASYENIRQFLMSLKTKKNLTPQTINFYISKIRFFHIYVLDKPWNTYQVPFAKFNRVLPEIFSPEEARYFITSMTDLRLKAISALMYGSGLRLSEVRHLKYENINRKDQKIYIEKSKSRSDRYALLPSSTLSILTDYWYRYGKPKDWLFPSRKHDKPIYAQTIGNHLNKHCKNIKWHKHVSSHIFRHSFSTHLYENGVDLLTLQKLLGHKSIESTTIYVHLSNLNKLGVTSPMDWTSL